MMHSQHEYANALFLLATIFIMTFPCDAQTKKTSKASTQPTQTTSEEGQRGTVSSEEFINVRPGGHNENPGRYRYRQMTSRPLTRARHPLPKGKTFATIGVTIARGRAATETESKNFSVAKVGIKDGRELVFERISDNSPVEDGTLMQMTIEYLASPDASSKRQSNRIGYLYVINRVQYADDKFGPTRLIFPTSRTYGGDNRMLPGKTVTLPAPGRPWQITRSQSGPAQAFETYTIIISPVPLRDNLRRELQGGDVSGESVGRLVSGPTRIRGGGESRGDLESGEGQLITQREQAASGDPALRQRDTGELDSDLTQDDPPPQIVFTKVVKPGGKMLVTIKLPFKDTAATAPLKP